MIRSTTALLLLAALGSPALAAEPWEEILHKALQSKHSQTRHNGVKGIDTNTEKGLKTLWKVLASEDTRKRGQLVDWYVREGAYEALLRADSPEAEAEIDRVLSLSGKKAAKLERAQEAIVQAVVWKLRKQFVKVEGKNSDEWIEDAKYRLRKTRGVAYFKLIKPTIESVDPEGKLFARILKAYANGTPRVKLTCLVAFRAYPSEKSLPLLFENLERLSAKARTKKKNFKEWVETRFALETLTGQDFREDTDAWLEWWKAAQEEEFTIAKRIEEEREIEEAKKKGEMRTVTRGKVTVEFPGTIVRGKKDGYPLLVLPWRQYEPDYFRPYFHGIEEECLVYYVKMPKVADFKGLERHGSSNLVKYPMDILADALVELMKQSKLERFAVMGHGPESSALAMKIAAAHPKTISHLLMINPRSSGAAFGDAINSVIELGKRERNHELHRGGESLLIDEDTGKPTYIPAHADEAGGIKRTLANLRWADPTDPAVGNFTFLFEDGDSAQTLADDKWRAVNFFEGKPRLPVMILMGHQDPWTPVGDMQRVAAIFKRAQVIPFPDASEFPFMSETYKFNLAVQKFLARANKSLAASSKKKSKKRR